MTWPAADRARLDSLASYDVLDTPGELGFDDVVQVASALCGAPIALVSLVAADRQWFKARLGFAASETPLDESICSHGLSQAEVLVIPDLTRDARTRENRLVTAAGGVRFYAGAPLVTPEGAILGMLCVMGHVPRPAGLSPSQVAGMKALGRQVMTLLELRRSSQTRERFAVQQAAMARRWTQAAEQGEAERRHLDAYVARTLEAHAAGQVGTFEISLPAERMLTSPEFRRLFGLSELPADAPIATFEALVHPDDRRHVSDAASRGEGAVVEQVEYRITPADGAPTRWLRRRANLVKGEGGRVERMIGTIQDITAEVAARDRIHALLDLGDRLRDVSSPEEVTEAAAKLLGETLGATRTGYAAIDLARGVFDVQHDWLGAGAFSVAGQHPTARFQRTLTALTDGRTLAVANVPSADWLGSDRPAYAAMQVRSQIVAPLYARGELVAAYFVHDARPRTWTKEEIEFVHGVADRTYAALAKVRAEREQALLNHEISHRLKNTLAMVQAIAAQTLKGVTPREAVAALDQRLQAFSAAHDLLLQSSWVSADLETVVRRVLDALGEGGRCAVCGPTVALGPKATLSTSLLIHELATNAIKYGALSASEGRLDVRWSVADEEAGDGRLELRWTEHGGPPAVEPPRKGFGSRLLALGLVGTGGARLGYEPGGLEACFTATLKQLQQA